MERRNDCKIVLETGEVFEGIHFGAKAERVCELVFNTSMVGYQEIVTDPSSYNQAVVMTYPIIGNYGITDEDYETKAPTLGALIVRDYNDQPSNFRCTKSLGEILEDSGIPAIYGFDTRRLTRMIRDNGSCKVLITDIDTPMEECVAKIKEAKLPTHPVAAVSCRKKFYSRTEHAKYNVVAIDCGIKNSMLRSLRSRGCNVTIVPYNTPYQEIERLAPDGIFISNGPGNPEELTETQALIKELRGKYPVFGLSMGCQLIALTYGAKTFKMKFGHRGGNQPVRNLATGKLEICTQNHGYGIDAKSLEGTPLKVTHVNILDGEVEGIECEKDRIFGVLYHADSAPDLQHSGYHFDKFVKLMEDSKNA